MTNRCVHGLSQDCEKCFHETDFCFRSFAFTIRTRMDALEELVNRITEDDMRMGKKPHKCPICLGTGWRKGLEGEMSYVPCDPCDNEGIVWG